MIDIRWNKYNAKRSQGNDGYSYQSQAERDYHDDVLWPMQQARLISNLARQPQVWLSEARIGYKPDFVYTENGREVYVDVKGVETDLFKLKCKLWRCYGPAVLRVVKRDGRNWKTVKEIMPDEPEGD